MLEAPRSTAHYRRRHLQPVTGGRTATRPGPVGTIGDEQLERVLRLLRRDRLLAPQRAHRRRSKRLHLGTIIPAEPNRRWGTDATMAWTVDDGWVWVFDLVDHYTAEA